MVQPSFQVAESKVSVRSHVCGPGGRNRNSDVAIHPGQDRDPGLIDTAGNRTHGHRSEICESAVSTIVLKVQRDYAD
jgi:hypothetical protein